MPTFLGQKKDTLLSGGTVALGFFDGCHLGHREILETCCRHGGKLAAVFTFPNHPTTVIPGRAAPALVTSCEERIELLESLNLRVFLKEFDRDFSSWSAERFVSDILVCKLGVSHVVVGHDYRFGHRAAGDVELLQSLGEKNDFACTVVEAVMHEGEEPFVISSTRVRQAVAGGEMLLAHQLLGQPYFFSSRVSKGLQKGRTIGFPTANLSFPEGKVSPPHGVFAIRATLSDGTQCLGVANYGLRPTVQTGQKEPLFEAHLFDFDGVLYGSQVKIEICAYVRGEKKFGSLDELRQQILTDEKKVRAFFSDSDKVG